MHGQQNIKKNSLKVFRSDTVIFRVTLLKLNYFTLFCYSLSYVKSLVTLSYLSFFTRKYGINFVYSKHSTVHTKVHENIRIPPVDTGLL